MTHAIDIASPGRKIREKEVMTMKITSPAFADHQLIPDRHTCDDADLVPPLVFEDVPANAKSLALVMDDPDVPRHLREDGNWDHWVVWNIPPDTRRIDEGKPPQGVVGMNSWGRNDWGGPCPPDRQHRYFFKLFALDTTLDLPTAAGKPALMKAMEGHVLANAELVGVYDRKSRRK